jgi:hypothetical protein
MRYIVKIKVYLFLGATRKHVNNAMESSVPRMFLVATFKAKSEESITGNRI